MKSKLEKYQNEITSMNVVINEDYPTDYKNLKNINEKPTDSLLEASNENDLNNKDEKTFLPFIGNGNLGLSLFSKNGLYLYHQKSSNLKLSYNPLAQAYVDTLPNKGLLFFFLAKITFFVSILVLF
jgi:hypothetical protein